MIWKEKIGGVRIMLLIHDSSKILVKRAIMLRSNLLFLRKELYLKRKERKQLTNDERVEMTMRSKEVGTERHDIDVYVWK